MIQFSCQCGHAFSVAENQAGDLVQCPQCHRLNDVPTLSDLRNIEPDGSYKLDDAGASTIPADDPDRISELTYVFTRDRYDAQGAPIDLRSAFGDETGAPAGESSADADRPKPKYDPVTGELVEALDVSPETRPNAASIPVARRAPIKASTTLDGMDIPEPGEVLRIPFKLFRPANLLVVLFLMLGQAVGQAMAMVMAAGLYLFVPVWMLIHGLILAHFATTVDETGPSSHDELPTPLRHLDWHDDLWGPFTHFAFSLMLCYAPAVAVLVKAPTTMAIPVVLGISGALAVVGTFYFPAMLLTMCTSGTIFNARPDRVLSVIARCGPEYIIAVLSWIVGIVLWIAGTLMITEVALNTLGSPLPRSPFINWYVGYGLVFAGIYFLHLMSWHLGALYRMHHTQFPWMLQRHEGTAKQQALGFPVKRAARRPRGAPQQPRAAAGRGPAGAKPPLAAGQPAPMRVRPLREDPMQP